MKNRPRGGLGRGLGALIPTAPSQPAAAVATDEAPAESPAPAQFVGPAEPVQRTEPAPVPPADSDRGLAPVPGARFAELQVSAIEPNAKQPRPVFDEEALEELKSSIQEVGLLQPIFVREIGNGRYELVM